jgi:hypothetical protein
MLKEALRSHELSEWLDYKNAWKKGMFDNPSLRGSAFMVLCKIDKRDMEEPMEWSKESPTVLREEIFDWYTMRMNPHGFVAFKSTVEDRQNHLQDVKLY